MRFRYWVFLAIGLFAVGLVFGLTARGSIAGFLSENLGALRELGSIFGPFKISTAVFIYVKNVSALVVSFIFSPLLLLLPISALVVNSGLLSFVSAAVIKEKSLGFLLVAILPHGIFEIPAIIIGEAAALSFGTMAIASLFSAGIRQRLVPNLKQNVRYLILALVMLLPAAIIETFITPLLVR